MRAHVREEGERGFVRVYKRGWMVPRAGGLRVFRDRRLRKSHELVYKIVVAESLRPEGRQLSMLALGGASGFARCSVACLIDRRQEIL